MKVELKKLDSLKRLMKVVIEGEALLKEKNDAYLEAGKDIKVSGFRPGKAPLEILEKQHGEHLKEKFLNKILPVYYIKALEEQKLFPIDRPNIYDVDFHGDKLSFSAEFEVRPEIDLKESDYIGIKVTDKKIEVGDGEIKKVVDNIREMSKKVLEKDIDDLQISKWAGQPDLERLKETIKAEIWIQKAGGRRQEITAQVRNHLLKNIKVDVSKTEVERHHKNLVDREVYNLQARGVSEADLEKYKKDIEEKIKPFAQDEIKLSYILGAIAQKCGLKLENNSGEAVLGYILSQAEYR